MSVTMMSRLILNINSYGDRHARRQSTMRPNPNLNVMLDPSTQFTTHVTNYSSWIARTVNEFGTEFDSDASTGLTFSAGSSGPTNNISLSDDDYATHDENDIEMSVRRRVTHDPASEDGAPTRDSGSGWWWSTEEGNA